MTVGTAPSDRETIPVILGPETTVVIPLADAVVEYFRLNASSKRSIDEERVFVALTLSLGTLINGPGAAQLYEALKTGA